MEFAGRHGGYSFVGTNAVRFGLQGKIFTGSFMVRAKNIQNRKPIDGHALAVIVSRNKTHVQADQRLRDL